MGFLDVCEQGVGFIHLQPLTTSQYVDVSSVQGRLSGTIMLLTLALIECCDSRIEFGTVVSIVRSKLCVAVAMAACITTVVSIRGGRLKKPWTPSLTYVDNVPFLQLNQRDHRLAEFVNGCRRDTTPLPGSVFSRIKQLRDDAVQHLLRDDEVPVNLFDDTGKEQQAPKRIKVTDATRAQAQPMTTVKLPDIDGDTFIEGFDVRVLVDHPRKNTSIELTEQVLDYIRASCELSIRGDDVDQPNRRSSMTRKIMGHNVRFEHRRRAWYIRCIHNGKSHYHEEPVNADIDDVNWDVALSDAEARMAEYIKNLENKELMPVMQGDVGGNERMPVMQGDVCDKEPLPIMQGDV